MDRPLGVRGVATLFFLVAAYLMAVGLLMLAKPGLISIAAGAPLLGGLEVAGPYAFLMAGVFGALVGYGLMQLKNWARRLAILMAIAGLVLLIPSVSSGVAALRVAPLASAGLGVIVRAIIVWYLSQSPVREAFAKAN
jgi:hypothetical protein